MNPQLLPLFISFFRIGFFGFGGGYAMLTLMEYEVIQLNGWITTADFLNIIAIAEMAPGPIAINTATFVGYRVADLSGAVIATLGLITPPILLCTPAAILFNRYRENATLQQILKGIHPATIAIIVLAAYLFGRSTLIDPQSLLIFGAGLALLLLTKIHPLLLIGVGAVVGVIVY